MKKDSYILKTACFICLMFLFSGCTAPSVTVDNPAIVTFQFEHEGQNVATLWRRIDGEQHGSKIYAQLSKWALAMADSQLGSFAPHSVTLDPGTYYLDAIHIRTPHWVYSSRRGNWVYSSERYGWNEAEGRPYFFSFTVNEGDFLILPKVSITLEHFEKTAIPHFSYEDPEGVLTAGERVIK